MKGSEEVSLSFRVDCKNAAQIATQLGGDVSGQFCHISQWAHLDLAAYK